MIIAVFSVGMVQVSMNQVIHVIAVRDSLVAATGTMGVLRVVEATIMRRCAFGWVFVTHGDAVIIYVTIMQVMQVSVMKVISVAVVPHGCVSASRAVSVGVAVVFHARGRHYFLLNCSDD
jgi:hypothetical protein